LRRNLPRSTEGKTMLRAAEHLQKRASSAPPQICRESPLNVSASEQSFVASGKPSIEIREQQGHEDSRLPGIEARACPWSE
jgi:hypothetical protein